MKSHRAHEYVAAFNLHSYILTVAAAAATIKQQQGVCVCVLCVCVCVCVFMDRGAGQREPKKMGGGAFVLEGKLLMLAPFDVFTLFLVSSTYIGAFFLQL